MGDLAQGLANATRDLEIDNTIRLENTSPVREFQVQADWAGIPDSYRLRLKVPDTAEKRIWLRNAAVAWYYQAANQISNMINTTDALAYAMQVSDNYTGDVAPGPAEKMLSDLASITGSISDLKVQNSQEQMALGLGESDEWKAQNLAGLPNTRGRVAATKSVMGNVTKLNDGTVVPVAFSLLPAGVENISHIDVRTQKAIDKLIEHEVDVLSAQIKMATNADLTLEAVKKALLNRENAVRDTRGANAFQSFDEMANTQGYGINEVRSALEIMTTQYALAIRRLTRVDGNGTDLVNTRLQGWNNPSSPTPNVFRIATLTQKWTDTGSGPPESLGSTPILAKLEADLLNATGKLGTMPDYKKYQDALRGALEQLQKKLGKTRTTSAVKKNTDTSVYMTLTRVGPPWNSTLSNEKEVLAVYPASMGGDPYDPTNPNFQCFREPDCRKQMFTNGTAVLVPLDKCDLGLPGGLARKLHIYGGLHVCVSDTFTLTNQPLTTLAGWVVEAARVVDGSEPINWHAVMAIPNRTKASPNGSLDAVSEDGDDAKAVGAAVDQDPTQPVDSNRVYFATAAGTSPDEAYSISRDWVPAIDNELIDPSGGIYETSYTRYLELARIAASKAADMREQLTGDLITEASDEAMAGARANEAMNNYFTKLGEICGDVSLSNEDDITTHINDALMQSNFGEALRANDDDWTWRDYGCSSVPGIDAVEGKAKTGTVVCAEDRECRNTTLGDLGIVRSTVIQSVHLNLDSSPSANLELGLSVMPPLIPIGQLNCDEFEMDWQLYNPDAIFSMEVNDSNDAQNKMAWLRCWVKRYRERVKALLATTQIGGLPSQIVEQVGVDDGSEAGYADLQAKMAAIAAAYGHGSYYEALLGLGNQMETLRSSVDGYFSEFENASAIVDTLAAQLDVIESQTDWNIATQATAALAAQGVYDAGLESKTLDCLEQIDDQFSDAGQMSIDIIKTKLDTLAGGITGHIKWGDVDTKSEFIEKCSTDAERVLDPQLADIACKAIGNKYWTQTSWAADHVPTYIFAHCNEEKCSMVGSETSDILSRRENVRGRNLTVPALSILCAYNDDGCYKNGWNQMSYIYDDNFDDCDATTTCDSCDVKDLCDDSLSSSDSNKYIIYIAQWARDEIATTIRDALKTDLLSSCYSENNGCSPGFESSETTAENPDNVNCTGPASDVYQGAVDAWGPGGDLYNKTQDLKISQEEATNQQFRQMLIQTARNLAQARHEVAKNIRDLAAGVGRLNGLEQQQIDLVDTLIVERQSAMAASISNLGPWQDRFDYRKTNYAKQLMRAKIAAWTARRAIEFRLGVDLSDDFQTDIYGNTPSDWADGLFKTLGTTCGEDEGNEGNDTDTSNDTGLGESCYSEDDLVEDYVQHLEDYVLSYGNSPNQQQSWWFHEDDDTAVISLRDDILLQRGGCGMQSERNWLDFTEEMELTYTDIENRYGSAIASDAQPWVASGLEITPNDDLVGLPVEVVEQHAASPETGVLQDQESNEMTAEKFEPTGLAAIYLLQHVDPSEEEIPLLEARPMVFSLWSKNYPLQDAVECDDPEIWFEEVGRCGLPCDVSNDDAAAWACPEGQVCVSTPGNVNFEFAGTNYMAGGFCDWCAADNACIGQTGLAGILSIGDGVNNRYAQRNAVITNTWTRNQVDSAFDYTSEWPGDGEIPNRITVGFTGKSSINYVRYSENFESWIGTDAGETVDSDVAVAIDGTQTADRLNTSGLTNAQFSVASSETQIQPAVSHFMTASVWLKAPTQGGSVDVTLRLSGKDGNGNDFVHETMVEVGDGWQRHELIAGPHIVWADVKFSIRLNSGAQVDAWGAQLEVGRGATIYRATGKNLLTESIVPDNWAQDTEGSIKAFSANGVRGPDKRIGEVVALTKNVGTGANVGALIQSQANNDLDKGTVFSVWVKASVPQTPVGLGIRFKDVTGNDTLERADLSTTLPDTDWHRLSLALTTENADARWFVVKILPYEGVEGVEGSVATTAPIYIWGPQLEYGSAASGYEPTDLNGDAVVRSFDRPETMVMKGGSSVETTMLGSVKKAAAALVGAQLRVVPAALLAPPSPVEGPHDAGAYIRNTYLDQHYLPSCTISIAETDGTWPTFEDLVAQPGEIDIAEQLRGMFDYDSEDATATLLGLGISSQLLSEHGVIAADNFNYRIRTVAVNLVGTDVLDCAQADIPANCAANPWVSYDLRQSGDVVIKNHSMQNSTRAFKIPTGEVNGAKAWAAEQVIGYPTSGAHQSVLSQIQKVSLMGRPLDGTFDLILYGDPNTFNWNNVEDVQLVIGYHYWTRSE